MDIGVSLVFQVGRKMRGGAIPAINQHQPNTSARHPRGDFHLQLFGGKIRREQGCAMLHKFRFGPDVQHGQLARTP